MGSGGDLGTGADSEAPTRRLAEREPDDREKTTPDLPHRPSPELLRGDRIGRYILMDRIGAGGMGVVYRAYDPKLDRPVALKVLHETERGSAESTRREERLLREAQALARVSHPNIVKVHDVGTVDGRIFIAMELIEGGTLKRWMREGLRPWKEVVDRFVQAGRGLVAAHDADVVHRDFKPENVLLGNDGGVYVVDFGLARTQRPPDGAATRRPALDAGSERARHAEIVESSRKLVAQLTETGTVLGTPAYMAPEQHAGGRVDARADQFGFCVALFEALYGVRPFPGDTVDELISAVMRHQLVEIPRARKVPAILRRIVLRGLNLDPADRYPSMRALLRRLEAQGATRRLRLRLGVAAVGVIGIGIGASTYLEQSRAATCDQGDANMDSIWNDSREQEMRHALSTSGRAYAGIVGDNVSAGLDRYAEGWKADWRRACEATHTYGEQSAERLDRRESCLRDRLLHVQALVDELSLPGGATVDQAVQATSRLPSPRTCDDPKSPTSTDPRGLESRRGLATATVLLDLGRLDAAAMVANRALEGSAELDLQQVAAGSHLVSAAVQRERGDVELAEESLYKAIWAADRVRADEVAARGWVELFALVSSRPGREREASQLQQDARAALERGHLEPHLQAQLATANARFEHRLGRLDASVNEHERALEITSTAFGPLDLRVAASLDEMASIHRTQGRFELAVSEQVRALAIVEDALGPDHPGIAPFVGNLGDALMAQGKHAEARIHQDRARNILESARTGGPPLP